MKDEIKEILDNTLKYLEGIDETRNTKILTKNETNILLDYITNLQEEKEDYKSRCEKAIECVEDIWKDCKNTNIYNITLIGLLRANLLNILNGGDK